MISQLIGRLTFRELASRTWRETMEDNVFGRAAELAYYFLLALLIVGGTALIMFGDRFAAWLAAQLAVGSAFTVVWGVVHYLLGLALMFLGLELIYYFGPNVGQDWKWITPGAVFAVVSLIIASLLFSLYLRWAPDYSATYGSVGAVVVLMLWLYLAGTVILIGGEINAEIAHAADEPASQKGPPEQPDAV